MWPRYRKNSTSTEVSRASHTHQAPHIGLPQMLPVSRHSAVKPAPTGPISTAARSAKRMPPDQRQDGAEREAQIAGGCEPGRRDMDIHDPHRVALLPVGGSEEQAPDQADRGQRGAGSGKPRQHRAGQAQKAPRVGETVQGAPRVSPTRGDGATMELASTRINLTPCQPPFEGGQRVVSRLRRWENKRTADAGMATCPRMFELDGAATRPQPDTSHSV